MKFLLVLNESLRNKNRNILSKCSNLTRNFKAMLKYDKKEIVDLKTLKLFLKNHAIEIADQQEIIRIYKILEKKKKDRELYRIFTELLDHYFKKDTSDGKYFRNRTYIKKLKKYSGSNLLKMTNVLIALISGNSSWAKREIKQIIVTDYKKNIFDFDFHISKQKILKDIMKFSEALSMTSPDKRLVGLYLQYVSGIFDVLDIYHLKTKAEVNWSEPQVREQFNLSHKREYLGLLYRSLSIYSDKSGQELLKEHLTKEYLENIQTNELWILEYFIPSEPNINEILLKKIEKLSIAKTPYEKLLFVNLLKVPRIKAIFEKNKNKKYRAVFQLEHDLFLDYLNSGKVIDFALYNLIKLGDYRENYLWWKII